MTEKHCDCDILTPNLVDSVIDAVWAAHGDGWGTEAGAKELQDKIEKLAEGCGIIKVESGYAPGLFNYQYAPTIPGKPPLFYDISSKKHKLVGVEKDRDTAELWANNMREHSGERIVIISSGEGNALYREE